MKLPALAAAFIAILLPNVSIPPKGGVRQVHTSPFGNTHDGQPITRYALTNKKGVEAFIINYGATLESLKVPDRNGKTEDIVLGYDDVAGYENGKAYFGGTIGRYGNRIARGQFTLDGSVYHIPTNDGPNSLHGGTIGFNKRVWTATDRSTANAQVLELGYTSPDGEQGFPGALEVKVTYTLPDDSSELRIGYSAAADKDTVLNLTNHSYFNLTGNPTVKILDHQLTLYAEKFTPVNATLIPTGELRSVRGTPFDFTTATAIGARIQQDDEQLTFGKGYDHNWVLDGREKGGLAVAAEVFEPSSGRVLEVSTTEPGVQFYSGNFLDGTARGKGGASYGYRTGLCLETQHFPDSPNHANFPSTELRAGQTYQSITVLRFSTRK
jgi:aldose 1-epimerase